MATKHNCKCLETAKDDEPIFVLKATDKLASRVVRKWAEMAASHGTPPAKVAEAMQLADQMDTWGKEHGTKTPD